MSTKITQTPLILASGSKNRQEALTIAHDTEPIFTWAAAFSPGNSRAITFIEYIKGPFATFTHSMPFEQLIPIFHAEGVV